MNYYLVNYIILDNKTVTKNETLGVPLHTFANIDEFKKSIALMKNAGSETARIVIKSYQQISKEAFYSLSSALV